MINGSKIDLILMGTESKVCQSLTTCGSKTEMSHMTSGSKVVYSNTFAQHFIGSKKKLFWKTLVDQNDQKRHFLLHQDKLISGSI